MNHFKLSALDVAPRRPQIIETTDEGRAIVLQLDEGGELQDHEVHERAWLVVVSGEVEISMPDGTATVARAGDLVSFAPQEQHAVTARQSSRLLLLLTPWPGDGHPGALTLEQKRTAPERAAARNAATAD